MNTGLNPSNPPRPLPYIRFVSVLSVVKMIGSGFGKTDQLFGERMDPLIAELNKELTA